MTLRVAREVTCQQFRLPLGSRSSASAQKNTARASITHRAVFLSCTGCCHSCSSCLPTAITAALRANVILRPDMTYAHNLRANVGGRSSSTFSQDEKRRGRGESRIAAEVGGSTERKTRFLTCESRLWTVFLGHSAKSKMSDS